MQTLYDNETNEKAVATNWGENISDFFSNLENIVTEIKLPLRKHNVCVCV